jgi:hypothetical protein
MATELATNAYYIGVRNPEQLQAFAVGCDTPQACIDLLKECRELIGSPSFREGKKLSEREIAALQLAPHKWVRII